MQKAAVVILNWNGKSLLEKFLPSVLAYTDPETAKTVVADNASTDDSIAFLQEKFPQTEIILLDKNYGYAEGYNRALAEIDTEYVILLNSDVEVTENWLIPVIEYMDQNPGIIVCQPKILSQRHNGFFEYAGACGGFLDKYGYPFCRGRIMDTVEKDHRQYDDLIDVLWASGACMFIRSADFKAAGGFDARFFAHMEEIDLCWRLKSRGKRIVCFPESRVYHVGAATLNVESPQKTYLNFRNNLLMIYKNLPEKDLSHVFKIRRILDYSAAFSFALKGKTADAKAVFKARKDFKQMKNEYKNIRSENISKTTCGKIPEIYSNSILLDYYLKGKKYFSMIFK
ncbi:MAG: glycosyltransferase family 2 protein [Candidatus Azobacteroides sp.]|nr:glycosyltransferase family 2 protein [Candidatus Azobacteroides sp.]